MPSIPIESSSFRGTRALTWLAGAALTAVVGLAPVAAQTREDVDRYAAQSQARAAHARDNGYFDKSIVPVKDLNGVTVLDHDELIRPTTEEGLAKLNPSFAM